MIKIAHECPNSIFETVQKLTDYDYCLVHKLDEDKLYKENFFNAKLAGREIILDNSIFELGEAYHHGTYRDWILALQPDYYIVPDKLGDGKVTIEQFEAWMHWFGNGIKEALPETKVIGVVQGSDMNDLVTCYNYMSENADKIAISFDLELYKNYFPHPNKWISYMLGRVNILHFLESRNILNVNKPHHLLGCALPQEGQFYRQSPWIDSVDTSNPVVHGLNDIEYNTFGLLDKVTTKLVDYMEVRPLPHQFDLIEYNIRDFRSYWN
jgi:hypothetical protein